MGRVKSAQIKRIARKLFEEHKDSFSEDFDSNKKIASQLVETSKKIRNAIAGYITKLAKKANQEKK